MTKLIFENEDIMEILETRITKRSIYIRIATRSGDKEIFGWRLE